MKNICSALPDKISLSALKSFRKVSSVYVTSTEQRMYTTSSDTEYSATCSRFKLGQHCVRGVNFSCLIKDNKQHQLPTATELVETGKAFK